MTVRVIWSAPQWWGPFTATQSALCPDLLRYGHIGQADTWRGRVMRGFFWLMRAWPVSRYAAQEG